MTHVAVAIIAKNESSTILTAVKSVASFASSVHLVDTGSTDNTIQEFLNGVVGTKCKAFVEKFSGASNENGVIQSFSVARNRSLDLAYAQNPDWVVWMDADDEIENFGALVSAIEKVEADIASGKYQEDQFVIFCPYNYAFDANGNVILQLKRERAFRTAGVAKNDFSWKMPVHEYLDCNAQNRAGLKSRTFEVSEAIWNHRKQWSTSKPVDPERNLRILNKFCEEVRLGTDKSQEVRALYYLGAELSDLGQDLRAAEVFREYLQKSTWADERYMAHMRLIHSAVRLHGEASKEVFDACNQAISEMPAWSEAYFHLCKYFYMLAHVEQDQKKVQQNWFASMHYGKACIDCPPEQTPLFVSPQIKNLLVHRYYNVACWNSGNVEEALRSAESALKFAPGDEGLTSNIALYKKWIAVQKLGENCKELVELSAVSASFVDDVQNLLSQITPSVAPSQPKAQKQSLAFYVARSAGPWNHKSLSEGIGGSETAVIHMADLLAKDYDVTVYCDTKEDSVSSAGALYRKLDKYITAPQPDILVSSRSPEAVEVNPGKKSFLWVHDVHCGADLTVQRSYLYDGIFVLSQWHKSHMEKVYPHNRKDNLIVTRNGIEPERFKTDGSMRTNKAIYSSSPDRGLEVAVRTWGKVREHVPDAELHVYYGFDSWLLPGTPNDQKELAQRIKTLMEKTPGVVYHGKVSQAQLAAAMKTAKIWYYPTWFSETSCISAMEAQCAGLRIITNPIAALKETAKFNTQFVEGDWLNPDFQSGCVYRVVDALSSRDCTSAPEIVSEAIQAFSWGPVAETWKAHFAEEKKGLPSYV